MRVLALDPGEKVGWARADISPTGEWSDVRHGITEHREMAIAVHRAIAEASDEAPAYDVIVCEDWRLYAAMAGSFIGSSFPSVQFIGAVRLCCWVSGTKLVMQGAAAKKPALAMMSKLDPALHAKVTTPVAHDSGHDMDALIHLFKYTAANFDLIPQSKAAA